MSNRDGMTRRQAIPLAIGSIAGSGILFLPSAVYVEAGRNSLLVWLLATAACLPMLLMFEDMVRSYPDGDGIEAFIRAGLGDLFGRCVPLMFLSVVIVGLPAGAVVAGRYVASALGAGRAATAAAAAAVLLTAVLANLAGARANRRVQLAGSGALVTMAVALLAATAAHGGSSASAVVPDGQHFGTLLLGLLLAFWTFVGFENLTFLSREFRRPERDFLPVAATSLAVYGILTALLTVAIAVRIRRRDIDQVVGLSQLAHTMPPRHLLVGAVAVIAVGATTINTTAWVWGVSRLVSNAANSGIVPAALKAGRSENVPKRAILLLGSLFAGTLTVLLLIPQILIDAVASASAIFLVLYLLSIVSYVRVRGFSARSIANLPLLLLFGSSLVQSGFRSAYGAVVLALALVAQVIRRRRLTRDSVRSHAPDASGLGNALARGSRARGHGR